MAGGIDRPAYIDGIAWVYAQGTVSFKLACKETQGASVEGTQFRQKLDKLKYDLLHNNSITHA